MSNKTADVIAAALAASYALAVTVAFIVAMAHWAGGGSW